MSCPLISCVVLLHLVPDNPVRGRDGTVGSAELQHPGIPVVFTVTVLFIAFACCTMAMSRNPLGDKHSLFSCMFGPFLGCLNMGRLSGECRSSRHLATELLAHSGLSAPSSHNPQTAFDSPQLERQKCLFRFLLLSGLWEKDHGKILS